MILYFLKKHFGDKDGLITPMKPLEMETDEAELARIFCKDSFKDDYRILNGEIRKLGFNIPPLVNAYESQSDHAYVWYGYQLRFWRCRRDRYPDCR